MTIIEVPLKACVKCAKPFTRKIYPGGSFEPWKKYEQRTFCSASCRPPIRVYVPVPKILPDKCCPSCGVMFNKKMRGKRMETSQDLMKKTFCSISCSLKGNQRTKGTHKRKAA